MTADIGVPPKEALLRVAEEAWPPFFDLLAEDRSVEAA
jgi:hypothetical protein